MFDEESEGDPHGECAEEIRKLKAELEFERHRADTNFASYERVKEKYSDTVLQINEAVRILSTPNGPNKPNIYEHMIDTALKVLTNDKRKEHHHPCSDCRKVLIGCQGLECEGVPTEMYCESCLR